MSGTTEAEALLAHVGANHPEWHASVDEPARPAGRWFVDIEHPDGRRVVVEWRPGHGFGVSSWTAETPPSYGIGADSTYGELPDVLTRLGDLLA